MVSSVRPWKALSKTITAGSAGGRASYLHGVLYGLGTGVQEDRLLIGAFAGGKFCEASAELDVRLVRADNKALVKVAVDLLVDSADDGREPMADVLAGDPARKVDVVSAVHILDRGAACPFDDQARRRDATRNVSLSVSAQHAPTPCDSPLEGPRADLPSWCCRPHCSRQPDAALVHQGIQHSSIGDNSTKPVMGR